MTSKGNFFILLCAVVFLIFSCASNSQTSNAALSLEELCNTAATEVSEEIDEKVTSVAILDVNTEYWAVSDYIVDELAHYFTRRLGKNVIAHDEFTRSLIAEEFEYQNTGMISDETIQQIGRELGVDAVIAGELTETSSGWSFFVKATQTETKKILSSWKGTISKNDREMRFQIEKSKKSSRPVVETTKSSVAKQTVLNADKITAVMIDEKGKEVSVLHPGEVIRFRVSSPKNAYLAILCVDARKNEEWLPLQDNYIRAGESRIFPDIPGAVLRVQNGIYGAEQVKVYSSATSGGLPQQKKTMGTRGFTLDVSGGDAEETVINYKVEK